MAISLRADNRTLATNATFAYLVNNYSAGVSIITVANTDGFAVGNFILIAEFGQETAEIFRIGSINTTSGDIGLLNADGSTGFTVFAHAESTKVAVISYNQVRFYWTAATGTITDESPTFDTSNPLSAWMDLEPSQWYTIYSDNAHSTGFGWFLYKNTVTLYASQTSNPIPYAGFATNTVATIFSDFDSLLNVKELKLVSIQDKFMWLNEALALFKNKLNLTNVEYTVSTPQTITTIPGTAEYQLPSDFSDLIEVYDTSTGPTNVEIPFIPVYQLGSYDGYTTKYYMRNRYIGFAPTPSTAFTAMYRYRAKAIRLTTLSDYIDLPDNAFFCLKDFMMYRASQKFSNPAAGTYYQAFTNSVNLFIQSAVKRDSNLDSFEPSHASNV